MIEELLVPGLIAAAVVIIVVILASGYVKAPPDTAYIISGYKKNPKVLIGRAGIRIPFLERLDKLALKQITIDVKTEDYIPTLDFINIKIDAVVKVRVSTEDNLMPLAMRNFLNKESAEIVMDLQDSLQGNMKEIIGTMSLKDINNNRDAFGNQVQEKAKPDMEHLGIEIISFNIQNVTDRNGLIEDMGMDNTAKIKKDAAIAKAEADRDVAIAKSKADQEANEARVLSDTEIARKNNELAIQKAELKKKADIIQAEADAAYEIQKEEQRKTIEITTANANIAKQEREVLLKQKEAEVKEKALDADIRKKAEADRFARQQEAEADLYERQKKAEASKFEVIQEAEGKKAKAEADKYAKEQEGQGIKAIGEAEAESIRAKGIAEAEAMEKKAEAYKKYTGAAVAEMLINILPDIAGKIAEPLTQIDKITIIGGADSSPLDSVSGNVPNVMAKVFETMKETVGIDMSEIIKANTYDAKVNRNINITGLEEGNQGMPVLAKEIVDAVRNKE